MIKRDREYRVVENISIICFAIGLVIACITRFIPFIYISVISVPISFWIISKNKVGGGWRKPFPTKERKQKWDS